MVGQTEARRLKAMLDTDSCIYAQNQAPGFEPRLPWRDCSISVVVLGELERGVVRSRRRAFNRQRLNEFLAAVAIIDLDAAAARRYAALRTYLEARGQSVGPNDFWIAAHALARGATLVTNNLAEFRRVPGLSAETWMTA